MKAGWLIKPLGDVCDYQRGLTYTKTDEVDVSENVVLRATNIDLTTNLLDLGELKYINEKVIVPDGKKVKAGSLIICTASGSKSHLGKVAYIDDDYGYAFGGFMGMVTPNKELNSKFLFHLMTSPAYKDFIAAVSDGANINNLKFDDLRQFEIPLPPLPEQQRIVTLLDEAFDGIATAKAHAEKNLQNARAIFESHLDAVLSRSGAGYTETTLGAEVDLLPGYAFPSGGYTNAADAVRLLRGDNIMQGYFRWEEAKGWSSNDCLPFSKFALQEGDVVIAMDRPWVKAGLKRAQICADDLPSLLVQRTSRLRTLGKMRMDFLSHLTGSQSFSRHLLEVQTGIGVPHISGKQIESFKFMLPPMSDQESIADALNELLSNTQRLEKIYEEKLTALDELKKSLLAQAFSGAL